MEEYLQDTIEYRNHVIKVYQDFDPINPRKEFDHLGHMWCKHLRYDLGDEDKLTAEEILAKADDPENVHLWLYLLDHSGLLMRTGRFACDSAGWDTSKVGIIWVSKAEIREEYSKRITPEVMRKVVDCLEAEVEEYSQYLSGEVYGYTILDEFGNDVDSCWGFYGWDYIKKVVETECKPMVDHAVLEWEAEAALIHAEEVGCYA